MNLFRLRGVHEPINFGLGTGINTVGRSTENSVAIPESSISGRHCEIEVDEQGVLVRDLQSTNGTFIDGQPVSEAWILPGQVLQLGSLPLRLEREQVNISVPLLPSTVTEEGTPATLPDGTLACSRNPTLQAAFRCVKCERPYHGSALRQVRLTSGKLPLLFCPECDGKCEIIPGFTKAAGQRDGFLPKKLLSRITQTIRLGWKKPGG
jgi:hypothetical protein